MVLALTMVGLLALYQGNYERATTLCEECLAIRWQIGDKGGCAHTLALLGRLALKRGEDERATRCYQESLALRQETGEKEGIAAALRDTMGAPLPPTERVSHEHVVAAVR